jgi:hypothetical protein
MTVQDSLVSFIKACDLFGESFTFKIRKKKYYTSIVGGFTSLCFIIYSLYYFTSSLADFFEKRNRTIEKENNSQLESEVKFSNHNYFTMAFCLRDNSMWIDDFLTSKIKSKAYLINNKIENKILFQNKKQILFEKCNSDNLKSYFGEYSALKQFEGCRCLNMTGDDIVLKTKYELIDKEFIQVEYEIDERNKNDVLKYLEKSITRLFVYFPSFTFSTKNFENPLQMTVHQENYELIPNFKHESEISLSQLIFNDFNSLYDDENSQILSRLTFEETKTNFFPLREKIATEQSEKSFVNIKLGLSNKAITFTSKVLLYDEFLGNFVGYLSNIIIILYCFNAIYNSFGARVYIAEKLFIKNKIFESKIVKRLKEKLSMNNLSNH